MSYSKSTEDSERDMVQIWFAVMREYPFKVVARALMEYIADNTTGFPPVPGQINEIIKKHAMEMVPDDLDEYTAWDLVEQVMRGKYITYEPEKAFKSLPDMVQKAVGTSRNLKQWSIAEYGLGGIKHDFLDRYRIIRDAEREKLRQPQNVAKLLAGTHELQTNQLAENINDDPVKTQDHPPMPMTDLLALLSERESEQIKQWLQKMENSQKAAGNE